MTTLRAVPDAPRTAREIAKDEEALRDALAAYATWPEHDSGYLPEIEEQVRRIRGRLPDRGARVDALIEGGVRFERGRSLPLDPPGSTRLRRLGAPEAEEFPRGPLNGGAALSALAAVAVALAGVA